MCKHFKFVRLIKLDLKICLELVSSISISIFLVLIFCFIYNLDLFSFDVKKIKFCVFETPQFDVIRFEISFRTCKIFMFLPYEHESLG